MPDMHALDVLAARLDAPLVPQLPEDVEVRCAVLTALATTTEEATWD